MPHQVYKNKEGKKVPSVTTIIGNNYGWNKQLLLAWQAREFKKGFEIYKNICKENPNILNDDNFKIPNDPTTKKEKAADLGTLCHHFITCLFKEEKPDDKLIQKYDLDAILIAQKAIEKFKNKIKDKKLILKGNEIPLISEKYQYGGCIDNWLIEENIFNILGDTKTSKAIYSDHIIQLGGYDNLIIENKIFIPDKYLFIHINKDILDENMIDLIYIKNETIKLGFEIFKMFLWLEKIKPEMNL
jgi:hypothetical protein